MVRKTIPLVLLIVGLLLAFETPSATLPSEEDVKGIQNLCGAGNIKSITVKGNVNAAIASWRSKSAGATTEIARRDLAAALDQVKNDANLASVYRIYVGCVADAIKRFLSTGPGPGSTPNTVTALRPRFESNDIAFSFEIHTNYSGNRGPDVAVEVCAEQINVNKCVTTLRPVGVGDHDISRVRLPIRSASFFDIPINVRRKIDFKACMSVLGLGGREPVRFGCRLSQWTPSHQDSQDSSDLLAGRQVRAVTDAESYQLLRAFFRKFMSGKLPYVESLDCCLASYNWKFTRLDACELTYSVELNDFRSDRKPNTDQLWNVAVDFRKLPVNAARVERSRIADMFEEIDIRDPTDLAIKIAPAAQGDGMPTVGASLTMNATSDALGIFMIAFEHLRKTCAAPALN